MALSDKERSQIIEEERVRWATRLTLMEEAWAHNGRGCGHAGYRRRGLRLLFWLPVLALVAWTLGHGACHF
jgi:hypothetical protein